MYFLVFISYLVLTTVHGTATSLLNTAVSGYSPLWVKDRSRDTHFTSTYVGHTVELKCKAKGEPQPTVKWYKDGKSFLNRKNSEPEYTKWSVRLRDVTIEDKGNYTCEVKNTYGTITWSTEVDIIYRPQQLPPVITTRPQNKTLYEGESTTLECRVLDMSNSIPQVQWVKHFKKNGSWVTTDDNGRETYSVNVVQDSSVYEGNPYLLELNYVSEKDAGWYTCIARNLFGEYLLKHWIFVLPRHNDTTPRDNQIPLVEITMQTSSITVDNAAVTTPPSKQEAPSAEICASHIGIMLCGALGVLTCITVICHIVCLQRQIKIMKFQIQKLQGGAMERGSCETEKELLQNYL